MSLSALLFPLTALLLMLTLRTGSKEFLDESDPLLLRSHQGTTTSFVLPRLLKALFMGDERLLQLVQRLRGGKLCQLFQLGVTQAFRVEDEPDIWCFRCWYLLQSSSACLGTFLISLDDTGFQWRHGHL